MNHLNGLLSSHLQLSSLHLFGHFLKYFEAFDTWISNLCHLFLEGGISDHMADLSNVLSLGDILRSDSLHYFSISAFHATMDLPPSTATSPLRS